MKLLLHIGTEKTGTTALQTWLHSNHVALRDKGVWVCRALEVENNFGAAVIAAGLEAWPDLLRPLGIETQGDLDAYIARKTQEIGEEVAAARDQGCHTFVISSEHLHARVRKAAHLTRLAAFLQPHFEQVEGVVFLRPQPDLSRSVQSNHIRWGVPVSRKSFVETAKGHNYDYWGLYKLWRDGFPLVLDVVPYKRHGDVVAWFCGRMGLKSGEFERSGLREKESVTVDAAAFLNAISGGVPVGPDHVALRERIIAAMAGGGPLRFHAADRDRIARRFRRGNKRLCRAVPGLEMADLEADSAHYADKGNVAHLDEVDFSAGLAALIARLS